MKSRTFYSAIALFAGLLILIGVAGFWRLTSQNPRSLLTQGGQEEPVAAQFVPRQAPVMVSLLARPDRVWQLRQLLTPSNQRFAARQEWQSLKQTLAEAIGWDYDTDLRPWLDEEVTLAVTTADLDRNLANGLQAGYLAVLSCRDAPAAREALHVLWQKRAATGRNLVFEMASGVSLIYDQQPQASGLQGLAGFRVDDTAIDRLASALIGDRYVLLANHPQVLREAIATYQAPDVSLAKARNYRESLAALPAKRIGWLYANLPELLPWLGLADAEPPFTVAAEGRAAHYLFMSFRAFPQGLLGDTAIATAPGSSFRVHRPAPQTTPAVLQLLPAETLFVTAGSDLSQFITDIDHAVGGYALTQRSLQALLASLSLPSATIPAELLTPLQGEFAIGTLAGATPSWVMLAQAGDTAPFEPMDAFAQAQGINVSQVQLGDRDITVWTRIALARLSPNSSLQLQTQVVGVHAIVNGYEVLANSLEGLQQILGNLEKSPLSKQTTFVDLMAQVETPTGAFTYLNWPVLAPQLTRQLPWLRAIEQAGQPLTAHLGPIVISGSGSSQSLQKGVVAVKLSESP